MSIYSISISRRLVSKDDTPVFTAPSHIVAYAKKYLYKERDAWREQCFAIMLDKQNHVLCHLHVSTGGFDSCLIDTRLVAVSALQTGASSVVLIHNHPSGNARPGQRDIEETAKVKKALSCLQITLLDHIVLADEQAYSFCEETMINNN